MQLWTALTQQFQHIAAGAMKEVGKVPTKDAEAAAPKDRQLKKWRARKHLSKPPGKWLPSRVPEAAKPFHHHCRAGS